MIQECMNKKWECKHSQIHGIGLFATKDIKKGDIILNWLEGSRIINHDEYVNANRMTAIRFFRDYYLDGNIDDSDRINHADNPNMICLFGLVFANRNIKKGDELTLDYHMLNAPLEIDVVEGYSTEEFSKRIIDDIREICNI